MTRPTFRDAYLVESDRRIVGAVRREGSVWRIFVFSRPQDGQPTEAYATREEAGERVIDLAGN